MFFRIGKKPPDVTIIHPNALIGRGSELESLRSKTSIIQIALLKNEETSIKKRLSALSQRGFYENFRSIARLSGELKKIESRIENLRMRDASGADVDLGFKIEKLERDFGVSDSLSTFVS